jgi:hypothetical protein
VTDTDPRIHLHQRFESTLPGVGSRRNERRYRFHADVEALPLDGRDAVFFGSTGDISHQGVFINAGEQPAIDSMVVLKIHSELGKLKLTARVVHRLAGIGFGCEFIDLDDEQLRTLSTWVALTAAAPRPVRTLH